MNEHRWWRIGLLSVPNISSCPLFANYIQPTQPHLSATSFAHQNLCGIRTDTSKEKAIQSFLFLPTHCLHINKLLVIWSVVKSVLIVAETYLWVGRHTMHECPPGVNIHICTRGGQGGVTDSQQDGQTDINPHSLRLHNSTLAPHLPCLNQHTRLLLY